ncbi:hypothetical protein EN801_044640, partial [Mesorhizobium sp. M00.F.Ca.ET.158.01.1.1]
MAILNSVAEFLPEIVAWRRDIHAHPELGFDIPRTSAFVAERLREFGCDAVALDDANDAGFADAGRDGVAA